MIDWLQNFGTLLAVLGALASVAIYLYGTSKKNRSDIVRQDNADLRASNQDKSTRLAALEATVTSQNDTIKNLREVATQTPAVTQLIDATTKQQALINKQHGDVIREISNLAKRMADMTTEFGKVAQAMTVNTKAQEDNTTSRENSWTHQRTNSTSVS